MNILEVIKYCQDNKGVSIPELQVKYGITYKKAKSVVDKLITDGELAYDCGIKYNYIGNFGELHEIDSDDSVFKERLLRIEGHRRELGSRMRRLFSDKDDEEDDDDEEEADELRYKALKVCVEKGMASPTLIQRAFPIGYIRACKLIDWMEEQGYVSPSLGARPRKVLITIEEFNKIINGTN